MVEEWRTQLRPLLPAQAFRLSRRLVLYLGRRRPPRLASRLGSAVLPYPHQTYVLEKVQPARQPREREAKRAVHRARLEEKKG